MSLMSRVRDIDDVPTLAASADDNALERLKEHIQRFVSTDDIAAIMAEQPSRARNELKSACRQAFEDASWAGVSQREQQRLTDGLIDMVFGFGPLESLLADDPRQTGAAFVAYLILTAFMTIGALRTTKVLFFIFLAIDFLFVGLALSAFGVAREATHMLAAISELVISLLSFYCAGANILNNHFGDQFLSLGNPFWSKKRKLNSRR